MGIVSRYGEMLAVQLQSEKICLPPAAEAVCATVCMYGFYGTSNYSGLVHQVSGFINSSVSA